MLASSWSHSEPYFSMPILEAASEHSQYDSSMNKQLPKFLHPRSDEKAGKELRCEDGGFISNGTTY